MPKKPKKIKNRALLMKQSPAELEDFWDEDVQKIWQVMKPRHQDFLKTYLTNGNNGSAAYREHYNPLVNAPAASSLGHQVLCSNGISKILERLSINKSAIFLVCQNTLLAATEAIKPVFNPDGDSAMDVDDHPTRVKAAAELAKLSGFYVAKTENTINLTKNTTINHNILGDVNTFLEKMGEAPIVSCETAKPLAAQAIHRSVQNVGPIVDEVDVDEFSSIGNDDMEMME